MVTRVSIMVTSRTDVFSTVNGIKSSDSRLVDGLKEAGCKPKCFIRYNFMSTDTSDHRFPVSNTCWFLFPSVSQTVLRMRCWSPRPPIPCRCQSRPDHHRGLHPPCRRLGTKNDDVVSSKPGRRRSDHRSSDAYPIR